MKKKIIITDDKDGKIIPTEQIFGKDADKVSELCMKIFDDALFHTDRSYTSCYRSPTRPKISDFEKFPGWVKLFKQATLEWAMENPTEFQKEQMSEEAWTAIAKSRFSKLFYLARKHRVHLQWNGTSPYYTPKGEKKKGGINLPDKWTIFKGHEIIAHIHCM